MTSTKERQQRAAARARLARDMAARQAAAKKRRQRTMVAGAAGAVLLVAAGTVWAVTALAGEDEQTPSAAQPTPSAAAGATGICEWVPVQPGEEGSENLTDVGTPPLVEEPPEGTSTIAMETNHGVIEIEMDLAAVPCTAASFGYLASQQFYDGSPCHRMTDEGIHVLQCGDPTGTGGGGPMYKLAEENLPVDQELAYPAGSVAMAKLQPPSTTGSQFFIVYEDSPPLSPDYTLVGTVTQGLDIVQEIAAAGHDGAYDPQPGGGHPNEEVVIETLRVSEPS